MLSPPMGREIIIPVPLRFHLVIDAAMNDNRLLRGNEYAAPAHGVPVTIEP
jgi:hypothetical protein